MSIFRHFALSKQSVTEVTTNRNKEFLVAHKESDMLTFLKNGDLATHGISIVTYANGNERVRFQGVEGERVYRRIRRDSFAFYNGQLLYVAELLESKRNTADSTIGHDALVCGNTEYSGLTYIDAVVGFIRNQPVYRGRYMSNSVEAHAVTVGRFSTTIPFNCLSSSVAIIHDMPTYAGFSYFLHGWCAVVGDRLFGPYHTEPNIVAYHDAKRPDCAMYRVSGMWGGRWYYRVVTVAEVYDLEAAMASGKVHPPGCIEAPARI